MRQIIDWAAESDRHPGAVVDEDTPRFAALVVAVRDQLHRPVPLRGGTEFTHIPVCFSGCSTGCGNSTPTTSKRPVPVQLTLTDDAGTVLDTAVVTAA